MLKDVDQLAESIFIAYTANSAIAAVELHKIATGAYKAAEAFIAEREKRKAKP